MPVTFQKRQKEMKRLEKQRAKAERRAQRKLDKDTKPEMGEPTELAGESSPTGSDAEGQG